MAAATLIGFAVLTFLVRDHAGPVLRLDESLGGRAVGWSTTYPLLADAAVAVSAIGAWPSRALIVAVVAVLLARRGRSSAAVFVVVVAVSGTALNLVVKSLVDRDRPTAPAPVVDASGLSFPSGHAMGVAICGALVVSALLFSGVFEPRARWVWVAVTVLVVVLVGVTRVLLGVHFASDVAGGWALGVGWVALATAVVRPWPPRASAAGAPQP